MEQQHLSRQPDLSQCPWYHGPTTRIASEMSLARDMEFLVRDCISSPGDYVLTTRWRGQGGTRMDRNSQPVDVKIIPAAAYVPNWPNKLCARLIPSRPRHGRRVINLSHSFLAS